jgi:subtilase family serine protease
MRCLALRRNDLIRRRSVAPADTPDGYGPPDLRGAYRVPASTVTSTVAIVDAYDDPTAQVDLAVCRAQCGLPPCAAADGCFQKVNQAGAASPLPTPDAGWAGEISLDLDMVSAICPTCHLLLVEADTNQNTDMFAAEDTAASRAHYVSDSRGEDEYSGQTNDDLHFSHPGRGHHGQQR